MVISSSQLLSLLHNRCTCIPVLYSVQFTTSACGRAFEPCGCDSLQQLTRLPPHPLSAVNCDACGLPAPASWHP